MIELISKERDNIEANHEGAYTKIYPLADKSSYDEYLKYAYRLYYKATICRNYAEEHMRTYTRKRIDG